MLADLIASDNYINFNIKTAQTLGLIPSIYISEITNIYSKAQVKNKIDENGFCTINRDYISKRTTIIPSEQTSIDNKLANLKIVKISPTSKDKISIDLNVLASIITTEDIKTLKEVKELSLPKTGDKKQTQRQIIINSLKEIATHPNPELNQAYKDWVDGVYSNPNGFLSKRSINIFKQSVDDYAKGDLDLALKIIDIATVNGYRECQWAITVFEKDFKKAFYQKRAQLENKYIKNNPSNIIGDEKF